MELDKIWSGLVLTKEKVFPGIKTLKLNESGELD